MDSDESINEERLLELMENKPEVEEIQQEIAEAIGIDASKDIHPVLRQQLRQPRCKSSVWIYFERLDTTLAKCRICQNNYRFGSSISNLRHHAEVKHGEVVRQGPVKFLELLKVPKEHLKELIHPPRPSQGRRSLTGWPHNNKKRKIRKQKQYNEKTQKFDKIDERVKDDYGNAETNSISYDESDMNNALDSIYQNSEDTINNYMNSPSRKDNDSPTTFQYERLDSYNNDYTLNGRASEIDEHEIDSADPSNINPLNIPTFMSHNDHKFQRLREERMRAETNYFNKKATYMERSAEYVEAQRQHVMLQSKKLKMEIAALKQSFDQS